jgi:hypothetical protein
VSIYNSIIGGLLKTRLAEVEHFKKFPQEAQEKLLAELLGKARNTAFGKQHQFEAVKNPQEFKNRVPIQTYDTLKPYIESVLKGESNVLWPSPVKWFAKSSGTTADKSKYIPVSPEALKDCHYKGGQLMLAMYYHANPNAAIFSGKSLSIGGSAAVNELNNKTYAADLSAIIIKNLPFWADFVRTPSKSVTLMPDWEEKINRIAEIVWKDDVRSLSGVPSWNLILLKKILDVTGKSNISEIWPNLELYAHGGVNFDSYRQQYKKLIPSPAMNYLETYNASEGFFGIQDKFDGSLENGEMLLMLNLGIFYEFLPLEELSASNPKTLQLNEVETGKNYAIIISTNGGLWRYMIGDTVTFTSLNPHRIKVSGRTKYYINIFGEELIEDNANTALKNACKATQAIVAEYSVAPVLPDENGKGSHEWVIEFDNAPASLEDFTGELDKALKAANSDYEAKRQKDMALQLPVVHAVGKGFFYEIMKTRGKIGGQNKVPRLSNNRDFMEMLLKEIKKAAH